MKIILRRHADVIDANELHAVVDPVDIFMTVVLARTSWQITPPFFAAATIRESGALRGRLNKVRLVEWVKSPLAH